MGPESRDSVNGWLGGIPTCFQLLGTGKMAEQNWTSAKYHDITPILYLHSPFKLSAPNTYLFILLMRGNITLFISLSMVTFIYANVVKVPIKFIWTI